MTVATDCSRDVAAALAGDEAAFAALTERHRRALHVHCYRLLASFDEAEDAVQEAFLHAWRSRESFDGGLLFRAWLYRIATHVCLDMLRRRSRWLPALHSAADVPWLQPYPDRLLDAVAPHDEEPDALAVARETIELAFLTALQALPPRQRAVFVARDVLGWPASETAAMLQTSVAAANSALQRARATMQERLPARRGEWTAATPPSAQERALLARFIDAHERCDAAAALAIASEEIRIAMPPYPARYEGRAALSRLLERAFGPARRRLAPAAHTGQPHARGRELSAAAGRLRVSGVQARRAARRGWRHRGDHHLRPVALLALRASTGPGRIRRCSHSRLHPELNRL